MVEADHQGVFWPVALHVTFPEVEIVAVMVPLTAVHQIVAGMSFRRAIVSGVGCPNWFGPVESTAYLGRATSSSAFGVAYLEP